MVGFTARSLYFRGKHSRQPTTWKPDGRRSVVRPPKLATILADLLRLRPCDNIKDNSEYFHDVMCSGHLMHGNLTRVETRCAARAHTHAHVNRTDPQQTPRTTWKGRGCNTSQHDLRHCATICLNGIRSTMKNSSQSTD